MLVAFVVVSSDDEVYSSSKIRVVVVGLANSVLIHLAVSGSFSRSGKQERDAVHRLAGEKLTESTRLHQLGNKNNNLVAKELFLATFFRSCGFPLIRWICNGLQ